jgi:Uma2 family endonuclease
MTAALKWNLISVEDYLAAEMISPTKHEYVGGVVHGMAGGRIAHNVIKGNIFGYSFARLRGNRCRPFDSDMRIRVDFSDHIRFYYPDVSVICRSNPPTDSFQDQPVVIFEVLSKKTRRIDIGEKKDAYLTIPSLRAYVLVEQESALLVVFRRTDTGFVREVYEGLDAVLPLAEIEIDLPLSEVYDAVEFIPESDEDDETP